MALSNGDSSRTSPPDDDLSEREPGLLARLLSVMEADPWH